MNLYKFCLKLQSFLLHFPGELWGYLQEFRGEKLANKPEKLYSFIRQAHNRAKEIQDAVDAVGDFDFDDDEKVPNEKRKIDEIEAGRISDSEEAEKQVDEQPTKKVKVKEEKNIDDTEENILENSPGSLDEKCERLSVNSNDTMEVEACEKGQASHKEFENKIELDSEESKVEILNEFLKTIEDVSDKSNESLQNEDKEPLAVNENKFEGAAKPCKELSSLFEILETKKKSEDSSETAENTISKTPSTTTSTPSSSITSPEDRKPSKSKIFHFFTPLEKS